MTKTNYMRRTYRIKALLSTIGFCVAAKIFAKQMFNYGSAMTVAYADEIQKERKENVECDPEFK